MRQGQTTRPGPTVLRDSTRVGESRGFTLLEMMIAVAILGISLLGLAQLLAIGIQQNSLSRYDTMAVQVARGKLEELRSTYNRQLETGIAAADMVDGGHGPETVYLPPEDTHFGVQSLSVSWSVTSPAIYQKNIEIVVRPSSAINNDGTSGKYDRTIRIRASIVP